MRYARSILVVLSLILTACTTPQQRAVPSLEHPPTTSAPRTLQPPPATQPPPVVAVPSTPPPVPTTRLRESRTVSWAPFILSTTLTLTSSTDITDLAWSPDGTQLLYRTMQTTYLLDMTTGQSTILPIPSPDYAWSPDGRQIGFVNRATHTFDTYDGTDGTVTKGTDIRMITTPIDWIQWTADGMVVYATQQQVVQHSHHTVDPHARVSVHASFSPTPRAPDAPPPAIAWSPQGDDLIAMDRSARTTTFFHGTERQITLAIAYTRGLWSPDGRLVVLTDQNQTFDVYDRTGTLLERASIGSNIYPVAWIDTERLIYTHNTAGTSPHNAYIFQRGSTEALAINEDLAEATGILEARVSPPGTYLAYTITAPAYQLVVRALISQ